MVHLFIQYVFQTDEAVLTKTNCVEAAVSEYPVSGITSATKWDPVENRSCDGLSVAFLCISSFNDEC